MNDKWYVYIVECCDGSYYTGITKDIDRRILEHNYSFKAAKYTRSRRPVKLVYQETSRDRSEASRRESQIKKMKRIDKKSLIAGSKDAM